MSVRRTDPASGAVTYAMNKLIADKDVKVTHLMFNFMEMVGGQEIRIWTSRAPALLRCHPTSG